VITLLPSMYLAFRLVGEEVFRNRATQFVKSQFEVTGTHIVDIEIDPKRRLIEVSLVGTPVSQSRVTEVINTMPGVGLGGAQLRAYQSGDQHIDVASLRSGVVRDLYEASNAVLREQGKVLNKLQSEVESLRGNDSRLRDIPAEVTAIYPQLHDVVLTEGTEKGRSPGAPDERVVVLTARVKHRLRAADQERLEKWLTARTGTARVRVVVDPR